MGRKHQAIKPGFNQAVGDKSRFTVVFAVIRLNAGGRSIKLFRQSKVYLVIGKVDNLFVVVPLACHVHNCINKNKNKNKIDQVFVGQIMAGRDNAAHQRYAYLTATQFCRQLIKKA